MPLHLCSNKPCHALEAILEDEINKECILVEGKSRNVYVRESVWGYEYAADQTVQWVVHIPQGRTTSSVWSGLPMNSGGWS